MADRAGWAVVGLLVLVPGCAGPTTNAAALHSQAGRSAQAAASEVATVDLALRTQLRGDAFWPATDVTVTTSEDALSSVADRFASRQPPTGAEHDYEVTSTALSDAADLVTQVRIAVRRHDEHALARLRHALGRMLPRLQSLQGREP